MSLSEELRARQSFLTTVEVIGLLHTTRGTLCEWVRSGRIPAVRVGNAYLFDPREMALCLRRRRAGHREHLRSVWRNPGARGLNA
jgi:excisionase family DNA binding protein